MEQRPAHTIQATIERVDNGAVLTVRKRSAGGDILLHKKVYTEPVSMINDLLEALDFKEGK